MIESHVVLSAADEFTASFRTISVDRDGPGIKKVRVFDQFMALIREASFVPCQPYAEILIEDIERGRFPIFIEAIDCDDSPPQLVGPISLLPPGEKGPGLSLPCSPLFCSDNPNCNRAVAQVDRARNEILERCSEVSSATRKRDAYAAAVAALFVAAAALFAAAGPLGGVPFIGQALALIALVFAVILLGTALGLSVQVLAAQLRLESAYGRLADARRIFTEAVDSVNASCCPGCITVDLTQPKCP